MAVFQSPEVGINSQVALPAWRDVGKTNASAANAGKRRLVRRVSVDDRFFCAVEFIGCFF
jgi:hypothetical protein